MASGTRICKVCGAEYEYCKSFKPNDGTFRWQDVACCEEHGAEYLSAIIASRTKATEEVASTTTKRTRKKATVTETTEEENSTAETVEAAETASEVVAEVDETVVSDSVESFEY